MTSLQAIESLGRANDRDAVLDAFFSFARQYFSCTVLFALREGHLLGLEATGLLGADVRALDLPVVPDGSVQAAVQEHAPRIVDLTATPADRSLAEALGRLDAQPCALVPVAIRQRIVAVLYGDRGGEGLRLSALGPLLITLPAVSAAFERIIASQKVPQQARQTPRTVREKPPSDKPTRTFPAATPASGPSAAQGEQENDEAAAVRGLRVPRAPRVPADLAALAPSGDQDELVRQPTVVLPAQQPEHAPPTARPAKERAGKRGATSYSMRPEQLEETRPHDRGSVRPASPSQAPAAGAGRDSERPAPRTLSQPPPGVGAYALGTASHEQVPTNSGGSGASSAPPPRAHRAEAHDAGQTTAHGDGRRDGSASAQGPSERVSIPKALRESLRPVQFAQSPKGSSPPLVLDLGGEAARLVEALRASAPDDDDRLIKQLVALGEPALPALAKHFPGRLWFDRHKPRKRLPLGTEISAVARALHAFDDKAVPFVAEQLAAPQVEARYAATLLAADLVHPDLLWPLYQRLFDADAQVRLIATEALPVYRNLEGFDEVKKSLRERAADESQPQASRLPALDALGALRDAGSVGVLIGLCAHQSRQLSVPAHKYLVAITGQDFEGERKWRAWLEKNASRHRIEWLIDGLMHPEERIRTTAGLELQKLTQVYYGFVPGAPKRERELSQTRYRNWWLIEGKRAFED